MPDVESKVAGHYTSSDLVGRIREAVGLAGGDPQALKAEDLKGVDEFHTGGKAATEHLLAQLDCDAGTRVLDIGCGLGGSARHIAQATGAQVTGVDLTPAFIDAAKALSDEVGLGAQLSFHTGSALDLPMPDAGFDLATMFHVGMNIEDKTKLFSEAARVLAPGGTFALFDIMRTGEGDLTFPFPWAETGEFSFVDRPEVYREAAAKAGFAPVAETERGDFARAFFSAAFDFAAKNGGPPPVGIHLLMHDTAGQKIQNFVAEITDRRLAPVEMIFRAAT